MHYMQARLLFLIYFISLCIGGCWNSSSATDTDTALDTGTGSDSEAEKDSDTATIDSATETDSTSESEVSAATIILSDVSVYTDCMPTGLPVKILAHWNAKINDATGTSAELTSANVVVYTESSVTEQTFAVDVTSITLIGGTGASAQRKTSADSEPSNDVLCVNFCNDSTYTLTLVFVIDGVDVKAEASGEYYCAG